jgi:taurine dioxygenase
MAYRHPAGPKVMRRLVEGSEPLVPTRFTIAPQAPTIGALVEGVDLRAPLDDELFGELDAALAEWKVLFFCDQHLDLDQHAAFAGRWGSVVDDHLILAPPRPNPAESVVVFTRDADTVGLENEWHTDGTFREMPTRATVLRAVEVPPLGGDTAFADMAAAFDNLSAEVRAVALRAGAVHDWSIGAYADKYGTQLDDYRRRVPPVTHPVVIAHPVTGRATLFVNRLFTKELVLAPADAGAYDADALLDLLCRQADVPEYQCRMRWQPGSIAMWDNIAAQHYGVNDYWPNRRTMARATVFGPADWRLRPARETLTPAAG